MSVREEGIIIDNIENANLKIFFKLIGLHSTTPVNIE